MRKGKHYLRSVFIAVLLICGWSIQAQEYGQYFADKTLRLDYIFSGDATKQTIALDELTETGDWAGRRHHLSELPLKGNGQITVRDSKTGAIIYRTSFSSLFQEWMQTNEAKKVSRSFQNSFLVPFPLKEAEVDITLLDNRQQVVAELKHTVDPADILIRKTNRFKVSSYNYLLKSGSPQDCIDVAILGEGYTDEESNLLERDAQLAVENLFAHEPFKSLKNRFNVVLVNAPSKESGISTPRLNEWKDTQFNSHFDTFYSQRYLTTNQTKKIHEVLAGIPYEHIIVLANSTVYGGGGIYNAFTLTSSHHSFFGPVVVHEFGHSFGGLADEYFYENDTMTDTYDPKTEPWEQNVTTLVDFSKKWEDMLTKSTPVPTPASMQKDYKVGVFEGAAYSAKGIYRGSADCRMKTNTAPGFCPVCQRALDRLIRFYTEK
ncbi:MAG: peptidase M64 [Bacteroidales bacterium 45-6]|nr:MAG: peptidase M64 [Bacteroidales bacterium 45-6]